MVGCENPVCPHGEWFHLPCVNLASEPTVGAVLRAACYCCFFCMCLLRYAIWAWCRCGVAAFVVHGQWMWVCPLGIAVHWSMVAACRSRMPTPLCPSLSHHPLAY